jgi:hypothetical protein
VDGGATVRSGPPHELVWLYRLLTRPLSVAGASAMYASSMRGVTELREISHCGYVYRRVRLDDARAHQVTWTFVMCSARR